MSSVNPQNSRQRNFRFGAGNRGGSRAGTSSKHHRRLAPLRPQLAPHIRSNTPENSALKIFNGRLRRNYDIGWTPASGVLAGTESSSHHFEALARQLSFDIHAGNNLCCPR